MTDRHDAGAVLAAAFVARRERGEEARRESMAGFFSGEGWLYGKCGWNGF